MANVSGDATAVTPAWRDSIADFTIIFGFNETTNATDYVNAKNTVHSQIEPFRQIAPAPQGGQYLNEVSCHPSNVNGECDVDLVCYRAMSWSRTGSRRTGALTTTGC